MFKLKDRQGFVRFLLQQALHRHRHNNLIMAYSMAVDPSSLFHKAFIEHPSLSSDSSSSPFLRKLVYSNVFGVNRSRGFTVKNCFDASGYGNSNNVFIKQNARDFTSLPRPPLLADLDDISIRRDAAFVSADNRPLTASPTKPLRFQDHHLSQKLVVAVDVDEGMYDFVCLSLLFFHHS